MGYLFSLLLHLFCSLTQRRHLSQSVLLRMPLTRRALPLFVQVCFDRSHTSDKGLVLCFLEGEEEERGAGIRNRRRGSGGWG